MHLSTFIPFNFSKLFKLSLIKTGHILAGQASTHLPHLIQVFSISSKLFSVIILLCYLPISCMVSCNMDSFGLFLPLWAILSFVTIGVVYLVGVSKLSSQREEKAKLLKDFETIKADYDKLKIIPKYDKNIKY